jgi:hypothetical protein
MNCDQVTIKKAKEIVIEEDNLWQVGFSYDALFLVPWMSGLVKIHEIYCNDHGAFFIVQSLDKTDNLFVKGTLRGSPLDSVKLPRQGLYVSISEEASRRQPPRCRPADC